LLLFFDFLAISIRLFVRLLNTTDSQNEREKRETKRMEEGKQRKILIKDLANECLYYDQNEVF